MSGEALTDSPYAVRADVSADVSADAATAPARIQVHFPLLRRTFPRLCFLPISLVPAGAATARRHHSLSTRHRQGRKV